MKKETSAGRRRLAKIAKACENYGQRVQNSVFECDVDASQYLILKNILVRLMNEAEDSLRFYNLGDKYLRRNEHFDAKKSYDPEGVLNIVVCKNCFDSDLNRKSAIDQHWYIQHHFLA